MKALVAVLAALALAIFGAFLARPLPGAPEVRFTTLAGERIATSDLRGKVAVVSFWSTTCGVCLKDMPQLVQRHRMFSARGYETIAVAVHTDHPSRVRDVAGRRRLPYKVAFDADAEASRAFGNVRVTPTTFVVDRHGRVLRRYVGKVPWAEFDALVEKALAG
jgi:peroxiredoxin